MAKGELVDMGKAEDAVKDVVKKRFGVEVTDVDLESTELTVVGNIPVYEIKGFASIAGGEWYFKAQVNAESGKVVGFKKEWFEPTGGVAH